MEQRIELPPGMLKTNRVETWQRTEAAHVDRAPEALDPMDSDGLQKLFSVLGQQRNVMVRYVFAELIRLFLSLTCGSPRSI